MADETASTDAQQKPWLFKPGQSGNPNGRKPGSRNKLTEDFLGDVLEAWTESGKDAVKAMIADKPGEFVKMVAGLVPKEATLNINDNSELTDAELIERARYLATRLAPFIGSHDGSGASEATGEGRPLQLN